MERYMRELRETSEKLCIAEAALHKKMNGLSQHSWLSAYSSASHWKDSKFTWRVSMCL